MGLRQGSFLADPSEEKKAHGFLHVSTECFPGLPTYPRPCPETSQGGLSWHGPRAFVVWGAPVTVSFCYLGSSLETGSSPSPAATYSFPLCPRPTLAHWTQLPICTEDVLQAAFRGNQSHYLALKFPKEPEELLTVL